MEKRLVRFLIGMLILIFILSSVSAAKTMIKIKTLQFHEVEVAVSDGTISDFSLIQRFKGQADKYGDINFTLDSQKSKINLYLYLKRNNEKVFDDKLMDIENNGKTINITFIPEGYEAIPTPTFEELKLNETNSSLENASEIIVGQENLTQKIEEQNTKTIFGFTGAVIKNVFSKKVIYVIIGVFMLLIVLFVTIRIVRNRGANDINREIKIRKLSDVNSDTQNRIENRMGLIEEAEKKIKEAQNEINKIKNEEKIKEIRKRMENEERELKRLSSGGQQ